MSWALSLFFFTHHEYSTRQIYAPINVNPVGVGGGGSAGKGWGFDKFYNFLIKFLRAGKRKVNQKCQKSPNHRGKNLNKQYYNTILVIVDTTAAPVLYIVGQ